MKRIMLGLGLGSLLSIYFSACTGAEMVRLIPSSKTPLPRTYFGMHIHRADTTTPWPVARIGAYRLWDAHVFWGMLEPAKGDWHFERLDKVVELALANGVEPLLTLGITPRWAASRPEEKFVYGYGGNSPPRDMRDWENYVRAVATRYKGRIKYFELWNEPTYDEIDMSKGYYAGSAKTMVELGRIAYRVIKSVDPANKLVSPAGTDDDGTRLSLYMNLGGKDITDVVAHHFYVQSPERIVSYIAFIRATMAKVGIADRPLWNTEAGYDIPLSGEALVKNGPRTDTELSAYIARSMVLGAAAGLERFYWYSWETTMLTRWRKDEVVNPIIVAYTQTMRWLIGASVQECSSRDSQLWICELHMDERKAWMVWNVRETIQWLPPTDWHAMQYETLDARLVKMDSTAAIAVGPSPLLVKSDSMFWSAYAQHPIGERP